MVGVNLVGAETAKNSMIFEQLCHSDWGKDPKKRWMCRAQYFENTWAVSAPELVGETDTFFHRVALGKQTLFGFDFPIGFPKKYSQSIGCETFSDVLKKLNDPSWEKWFDVCDDKDQISKRRPFYPYSSGEKGEKRQIHLKRAHGVNDMKSLLRHCEIISKAGSMFWTLGGKQVGKGMITGLQELIIPNIDDLAIWPFDGALKDLAKLDKPVICETYPGAAYEMIGINRQGLSKKKQESRRRAIPAIKKWSKGRPVKFDKALLDLIEDGFGKTEDGEDPFDALIGLMKMIDVVSGQIPEIGDVPEGDIEPEGWILGLRTDITPKRIKAKSTQFESPDKLSKLQIGAAGVLLVQYRLLSLGIESAPMTTDTGIDLVAYSSKSNRAITVQVKACLQSKPAGGKGRPLLNWKMRASSPAELVALVDLSTDKVWLLEHSDFEQRCQQHHAKTDMLQLYFYTEPDYKAKAGAHETDFMKDRIEHKAPLLLGQLIRIET